MPGYWCSCGHGDIFVRGEETTRGTFKKNMICQVDGSVGRSTVSPENPEPQWRKDATFILHAKTDIEALLKEVNRLNRVLSKREPASDI